jgi:hypothetical protein
MWWLLACQLDQGFVGADLPAIPAGSPYVPEVAVEDTGAPTTDDTDVIDEPACPDPPVCQLVPISTDVEVDPRGVEDPWNVVSGWEYWGPNLETHSSYTPPVVAQLDDDNGDGHIDDDDHPDVLVVTFAYGAGTSYLSLLDGATGEERWARKAFGPYSPLAVADIDGDGVPDIVGFDGLHVVALEADGNTKWRSPDEASPRSELVTVSVADLDGDGVAEVIADDLVLDGPTGLTEARLAVDPAVQENRIGVVGDVDLDGEQEIIQAGRLFSSDGTLRWDSGETVHAILAPALVQADCDPEAEILFASRDWSLRDHDGTLIRRVPLPTDRYLGAPCIGDLDGDGQSDVAIPVNSQLLAWHLDGRPMWAASIDDRSSAAGCTAYDLDNDGALEVIFADETTLHIFDGRTGAALFEDPTLHSATAMEAPVVADLDGDGSADILVIQSISKERDPAVRTWHHAGRQWPVTLPDWPTWDMAIDNLPDVNGTVSASPRPSWLGWNVLRAGPNDIPGGTPDLAASVTDVCIADVTAGPVRVGVRVENHGTAKAFDVPVSLYADDAGVTRLVAKTTLPAIDRGYAMDSIWFDLTPADVGSDGFVVVPE